MHLMLTNHSTWQYFCFRDCPCLYWEWLLESVRRRHRINFIIPSHYIYTNIYIYIYTYIYIKHGISIGMRTEQSFISSSILTVVFCISWDHIIGQWTVGLIYNRLLIENITTNIIISASHWPNSYIIHVCHKYRYLVWLTESQELPIGKYSHTQQHSPYNNIFYHCLNIVIHVEICAKMTKHGIKAQVGSSGT